MYKYKGSFKLISNQLIICDPFSISDANNMIIDEVISGVYHCFSSGSELMIYHASLYQIESTVFRDVDRWIKVDKQVAVDSGMIGIYDAENWNDTGLDIEIVFPKNNIDDMEWESTNANIVDAHSAGTLKSGFVSSTKDGDGQYEVSTLTINNELKGIKIMI